MSNFDASFEDALQIDPMGKLYSKTASKIIKMEANADDFQRLLQALLAGNNSIAPSTRSFSTRSTTPRDSFGNPNVLVEISTTSHQTSSGDAIAEATRPEEVERRALLATEPAGQTVVLHAAQVGVILHKHSQTFVSWAERLVDRMEEAVNVTVRDAARRGSAVVVFFGHAIWTAPSDQQQREAGLLISG